MCLNPLYNLETSLTTFQVTYIDIYKSDIMIIMKIQIGKSNLIHLFEHRSTKKQVSHVQKIKDGYDRQYITRKATMGTGAECNNRL